MYIAKINNDLYLKKAAEESEWVGSQKIHYKLTNCPEEAKRFLIVDDGEPFINNLKLYGFKFYKLNEVEVI